MISDLFGLNRSPGGDEDSRRPAMLVTSTSVGKEKAKAN